MQVTDIKVRFMRRVQVREYEPAEAEVSISAQIMEDEDPASAILGLMTDAKDGVREGLLTNAAGKTESKTTKAPAKESKAEVAASAAKETETKPAKEDKPKRGRRTKAQIEADNKAEEEKRAAAKTSASDVPGDDDIPGDDAKGNISNNPENRVDPSEVPGEEDNVSLDDLIGGGPTHEDLNELISNAVGGTGKKKVAGGAIKEILGGYKAARVRDVAEKDIQKVMDAIQAKIDG